MTFIPSKPGYDGDVTQCTLVFKDAKALQISRGRILDEGNLQEIRRSYIPVRSHELGPSRFELSKYFTLKGSILIF